MNSEEIPDPNAVPAGKQRWNWIRVGKTLFPLLIFLTLALFLGRTIDRARNDFAVRDFAISRLDPVWMAVSGMLYLLASVPPCLYWHNVMRAMGQRPSWPESFRAFYIGHLGKYVPGKFMVVLLRTRLIHSDRTEQTPAGVAVFIETLTTMAVGAILSTVYVAVYFRQQTWLLIGAIGSTVVIASLVVPRIFRALVTFVKIKRLNPQIDRQLAGLSGPLLISGWITIAASWVILGLSLWAAIVSMSDCIRFPAGALAQLAAVTRILPLLTACVALAVVAGFASMIPGGVGAREFVVTGMLPPLLGSSGAVIAALLIRVIWLLAEILVSAILYPIDLRRRRSAGELPPPPPTPTTTTAP